MNSGFSGSQKALLLIPVLGNGKKQDMNVCMCVFRADISTQAQMRRMRMAGKGGGKFSQYPESS